MSTAALRTIAKIWEQPKCPSTDEWIKKMQRIHITGYNSVKKKNEMLLFATIRMDLECIMLSQASQRKTGASLDMYVADFFLLLLLLLKCTLSCKGLS